MVAATAHSQLDQCCRRSSCGDESVLRREVRYERDARETIGGAKMLHFPRVNVLGARLRITAPSPWPGTRARCRDAGLEFVGRERELFQRGKMRPAPNASSAARARRVRAASHARCRNVHQKNAIRLPPGMMSAIAPYDPSSRTKRTKRTLQLVSLAVTATSSDPHACINNGNAGRRKQSLLRRCCVSRARNHGRGTGRTSTTYQFLSAARRSIKESSAGHLGPPEAGSRSLTRSPFPA